MKAATVLLLAAASALGGVAWGATNEPRLALTERQNELARTTNLRRGDLPASYHGGFVPGRPSGFSCRDFVPRVTDLTATGYSQARFATARGDSVTSAVTVFASAAQVDTDTRRTIRPPLAHCLGSVVAAANKASLVSAVRAPIRSSLDHAAAYQITLRRAGTLRTVRYSLFGHGRIECRLVVSGAGRTLPAKVLSLAVSLIESRMED
jgi:hypothetical protein